MKYYLDGIMLRYISAIIFSMIPVVAAAQPVTIGPSQLDFALPGAFPTGRFFGPLVTANPTSTGVSAANRLHAAPMYVRGGSTVKTLNFDITVGNASAWNARMCVYADNGSGLPGALVIDSGTVAIGSGSVTGVQSVTLSGNGVTLDPGWYWSGLMADSASESVSSIGNGAAGPIASSKLMGWASVANGAAGTTATGVYASQTFGACPATFPTPSYGDSVGLPYIWMGF